METKTIPVWYQQSEEFWDIRYTTVEIESPRGEDGYDSYNGWFKKIELTNLLSSNGESIPVVMKSMMPTLDGMLHTHYKQKQAWLPVSPIFYSIGNEREHEILFDSLKEWNSIQSSLNQNDKDIRVSSINNKWSIWYSKFSNEGISNIVNTNQFIDSCKEILSCLSVNAISIWQYGYYFVYNSSSWDISIATNPSIHTSVYDDIDKFNNEKIYGHTYQDMNIASMQFFLLNSTKRWIYDQKASAIIKEYAIGLFPINSKRLHDVENSY